MNYNMIEVCNSISFGKTATILLKTFQFSNWNLSIMTLKAVRIHYKNPKYHCSFILYTSECIISVLCISRTVSAAIWCIHRKLISITQNATVNLNAILLFQRFSYLMVFRLTADFVEILFYHSFPAIFFFSVSL